ncbi:hypothetical protein ACFVMC_08060 [Nocardia sp. NPDC127579]|uniref:hypothetical protein n=1 Tax=Nocardia sp. NPDC127579 TaxID=3345402 RepID=UPI00363F4003
MTNHVAVHTTGPAPLALVDGAVDLWRRGWERLRGIGFRTRPVPEPQSVPELLARLDPFNPAPGRGRR